jgi:hypothetical protein
MTAQFSAQQRIRLHQIDPAVLEDTVPPRRMRAAARRAAVRRARQEPHPAWAWAWGSILAFRITLTLYYAFLVYFGGAAFTAGLPAFRDTAPPWWETCVAIAVTVGGVLATIGSVRAGGDPGRRALGVFEVLEMVGTLLVFVFLFSYAGVLHVLAYVAGDVDRIAAAAGYTGLITPAVGRLMWLVAQLGKRKP